MLCYGINSQWVTNSPFGNFGYGDGRAASLVEVEARNSTATWELQLNGSALKDNSNKWALKFDLESMQIERAFVILFIFCILIKRVEEGKWQNSVQSAS